MFTYSKLEPVFQKFHERSNGEDDVEDRYADGVPFRQQHGSAWHWLRQDSRPVIIHLLCLSFNVIALIAYASGWLTFRSFVDPHVKTPLRRIIAYEERPFDLQSIYLQNHSVNPAASNRFNGPPRQDLEDAWDKLMQYQNIRVHQHELGEFAEDDSVVRLSDGSGYYSTVAVFHGLHYIQRLHNTMYPEVYYAGLSEEEMFDLKRHTEHCLDWLREYIQCNADTSLIPIQWSSSSPGPIATDTGKHQCVVWEPVYDWMASRAFNPSEPGIIVHPIFGDPYNQSDAEHHALGITPLGQGGVLHGTGHH